MDTAQAAIRDLETWNTSCLAKVIGKYSPSFSRQYVAGDLRGQTTEDLRPESTLQIRCLTDRVGFAIR
jgi:hypothetical protein